MAQALANLSPTPDFLNHLPRTPQKTSAFLLTVSGSRMPAIRPFAEVVGGSHGESFVCLVDVAFGSGL
jgi:hypothetical protein